MNIHRKTAFTLTCLEIEVWPGGAQSCLFLKSICECMPSFRSVRQRVSGHKYHFGIFWPDTITRRGVAELEISNYSTGHTDSKYKWNIGSNVRIVGA